MTSAACQFGRIWLRGRDLNPRPSGYEPDELPGCSTPRLGRIMRIANAIKRPRQRNCETTSALLCVNFPHILARTQWLVTFSSVTLTRIVHRRSNFWRRWKVAGSNAGARRVTSRRVAPTRNPSCAGSRVRAASSWSSRSIRTFRRTSCARWNALSPWGSISYRFVSTIPASQKASITCWRRSIGFPPHPSRAPGHFNTRLNRSRPASPPADQSPPAPASSGSAESLRLFHQNRPRPDLGKQVLLWTCLGILAVAVAVLAFLLSRNPADLRLSRRTWAQAQRPA